MGAGPLKAEGPQAQQRRARAAYEKVVALSSDTASARSMRKRMGLLCRAHLDKTFIAGAEQTAVHQEWLVLAKALSKRPPPLPVAPLFQVVSTADGETVHVYMPPEYAQEAFALGRRYQTMEITAQQAINRMQHLANQMCMRELLLDKPFETLRFLRNEIAGTAEAAESDGSAADAVEPAFASGARQLHREPRDVRSPHPELHTGSFAA